MSLSDVHRKEYKACVVCKQESGDTDLYRSGRWMYCLDHYQERFGGFPWVPAEFGGVDFWSETAEFYRQRNYGDGDIDG